MRDEIADAPSDLFAGVVDGNSGAQLLHLPLQPHRNVILFTREAIDFDEFDQEIFKSFFVDQFITLYGLATIKDLICHSCAAIATQIFAVSVPKRAVLLALRSPCRQRFCPMFDNFK
jgi:hypothetical protein